MGDVMRRYWIPALPQKDLPGPDGDPVAFQVLGERLVAFRDSEGKLGVLDELCCHRGASLALGRVEDGGIRCLFHGWKFAVDGAIQETPNMPDSRFKEKVRATAYPTHEAAGLMWVYLGQREQMPPFPDYKWIGAPSSKHFVRRVTLEYNWVQALEGFLDSSHLGILHSERLRAENYENTILGEDNYPTEDNAPKIEVRTTNFGLDYAAIRQANDGAGGQYVRVTVFIMPFYIYIPPRRIPRVDILVPKDDHSTYQYSVVLLDDTTEAEVAPLEEWLGFANKDAVTPDGRVVIPKQDREAMRRGDTFSGFKGTSIQDMAVQQSMGKIYDRSKEHVVPSDLAVIRMRRLFLSSGKRVEEGGNPIGLDGPVDTRSIDGFSGVLPQGTHWTERVPGNHSLEEQSSAAEEEVLN